VRSGLLRLLVVGLLALIAPRAIAAPNLCARDGDLLHAGSADRSRAEKPASATQAGIDALGATGARVIWLHDLMTSNRVCPIASFTELSRLADLTAVVSLPVECLPAFARTARLPALREIEIFCGDGTTIDVEQLLAFPALDQVSLQICRHGPTGLAPLAGLARLRTLIDTESDRIDGLDTLTQLTGLGIAANGGNIAPLEKLRGLRALTLVLHARTNLSPLGQLLALEQLVVASEIVGALDVAPLAALKSLRRLELRSQGITHGEALRRLTSLCALDLDRRTPIDTATLAGMRRLELLRMSVVGAPSLAPLARLRALTEVELWSGCAVPEVDLAPLARLPKLAHVSLSGAMLVSNGARLGDKVNQMRPHHCRGGIR
jgi:hypothetical protein